MKTLETANNFSLYTSDENGGIEIKILKHTVDNQTQIQISTMDDVNDLFFNLNKDELMVLQEMVGYAILNNYMQ